MKLIKPPALRFGDKVASVTLSSGAAGLFPYRYLAGKKEIQRLFNLDVQEATHALHPAKFIAENPEARAQDMIAAFKDPTIKGVFNIIGGNDTHKVVFDNDGNVRADLLDAVRQNPKVFIGFSDTTVLHFLCMKAGVTSFYGPSIMAGFAENGGMPDYSRESVQQNLFTAEAAGDILENKTGWTSHYLEWGNANNQNTKRTLFKPLARQAFPSAGVATGHLIGGCVETLERIKYTKLWPDESTWKGALLFLESSEEAPSTEEFRSYMEDYAKQGIFSLVNGIIFARPGDMIEIIDGKTYSQKTKELLSNDGTVPVSHVTRYDKILLDVVRNVAKNATVPVLTQMDFGHTVPVFTIPYGVQAEIDCARKSFKIKESGVTPCL